MLPVMILPIMLFLWSIHPVTVMKKERNTSSLPWSLGWQVLLSWGFGPPSSSVAYGIFLMEPCEVCMPLLRRVINSEFWSYSVTAQVVSNTLRWRSLFLWKSGNVITVSTLRLCALLLHKVFNHSFSDCCVGSTWHQWLFKALNLRKASGLGLWIGE